MAKSVNAYPHPNYWQRKCTKFIVELWSKHKSGYVFIGTRSNSNGLWHEHHFSLPDFESELAQFITKYNRKDYDLYFCVNSFRKPIRKAEFANPTPYSWVDIDNAPLAAFDPTPSILLRTSPNRHQGIWFHDEEISAVDAEIYSKGLAYSTGSDKNGWSITKYLRLPYTYNHKPEYELPKVELVRADFSPLMWGISPICISDFHRSKTPIISADCDIPKKKYARRAAIRKLRHKLSERVIYLLNSKNMERFEGDRSKCIFEMIAGLHKAGATDQQIVDAMWTNPYFVSKHGQDINRLGHEIARIKAWLGRQ